MNKNTSKVVKYTVKTFHTCICYSQQKISCVYCASATLHNNVLKHPTESEPSEIR